MSEIIAVAGIHYPDCIIWQSGFNLDRTKGLHRGLRSFSKDPLFSRTRGIVTSISLCATLIEAGDIAVSGAPIMRFLNLPTINQRFNQN